jgi:RluA family pseudouridine synthase
LIFPASQSELFFKEKEKREHTGKITPVNSTFDQKITLFEDEAILVINKPAGIPVLPDGWEKDAPYLVKSLEEQSGKLWVVHRLDKITSGVMVFARSAESHRSLSMQFEAHEAKKVYHAIMVGSPVWEKHIARHRLRVDVGHKHRTLVDNSNGKPSETFFRILERHDGYCVVEAIPATGRTHQVRAHASALGFPLLGDTLYGAMETTLIDRPALHAYSLSFMHPVTKEALTFSAPRPADFQKALENLPRKE